MFQCMCKCVHVRRLMISVNANRAQGARFQHYFVFLFAERGERERMEYAVSAGQTKERSLAGSSQNCVNLQFTTVGYRLNRAGWSKRRERSLEYVKYLGSFRLLLKSFSGYSNRNFGYSKLCCTLKRIVWNKEEQFFRVSCIANLNLSW